MLTGFCTSKIHHRSSSSLNPNFRLFWRVAKSSVYRLLWIPLQSRTMQNTSNGSISADIDAEITDGFSPLNSSHRDIADEDSLVRKAKMYQDYMKQIPIPKCRGSLIPFTTWVGLGISMKQLYEQPLHYLTNVLLQRWDQSELGTDADAEEQFLDTIIHPSKAETTIWLVEEIHRLTSSHLQIAHLWQSDSMYHSFVDPIFPKL